MIRNYRDGDAFVVAVHCTIKSCGVKATEVRTPDIDKAFESLVSFHKDPNYKCFVCRKCQERLANGSHIGGINMTAC